jgi:hypothetical protein
MTPSAAAAANIFSAAAAVVLFISAASPEVAKRTAGRTRSGGTKVAGESGRCLLTITHGLVGSVSECCGPRAAADGGAFAGAAFDDGAATGVGGVPAAVVLSGTVAADGGFGELDAAAAAAAAGDPVRTPGLSPGVGAGMPAGAEAGADAGAGVQALRAARPVPAIRRRLNARRLGESGPADCRPIDSPPPS